MRNGIFKDFKVLAGNSNIGLAREVAHLMGKSLCEGDVVKFSDGEISVNISETVRGSDVYIIQSTCEPVNDNLMELLIMIDAVKRASAGRINAVIPYYGYARQDRKAKARDPITSKLVADLITKAGADRVVTMDLHAAQIQGYFDIPVDHMLGMPILAKYFKEKKIEDLIVVSPDIGSVTRARNMSEYLDTTIAIVDKRRPKANMVEVMNIIGDIEGKNVLLIDDMVDTAGTITNAANALRERGAKDVYVAATHAVLSGPAIDRINDSVIKEMVLLNTIALPETKKSDKIKMLSVAPLFAEAMMKIYSNESISGLFKKV